MKQRQSMSCHVLLAWTAGRCHRYTMHCLLSVLLVVVIILKLSPTENLTTRAISKDGASSNEESSAWLSGEQQLLLQSTDSYYKDQIRGLQQKIEHLEQELLMLKESTALQKNGDKSKSRKKQKVADEHAQQVMTSKRLQDPMEVVVYDWYNGTHLMGPSVGNAKMNIVPVNSKTISELREVLRLCNVSNIKNHHFEGVAMRNVPRLGSEYQAMFRSDNKLINGTTMNVIHSVRPYEPLQLNYISKLFNLTNNRIIIILPLTKRFEQFKIFINSLKKVAVGDPKKYHLVTVYFGVNGFAETVNFLTNVTMALDYRVLHTNERFSKSRGIQLALESLQGETSRDDIVLMTDVDVVFSHGFFERCEFHISKGYNVYYPIVFNLFNPKFVYETIYHEKTPSLNEQLRINDNKGAWLTTGYGVSCHNIEDLKHTIQNFSILRDIGTFTDVDIFNQYRASHIHVKRIPDPSLFHVWHDRNCSHMYTESDFKDCIKRKTIDTGSPTQLGFLVFKDKINISKGL